MDHSAESEGITYIWEVLQASDPRLEGDVIATANHGHFSREFPGSNEYYNGEFRLENDAGTWTSEAFLMYEYDDRTGSTNTTVFTGAGEYDGLYLVAEMAWDPAEVAVDIRGLLIDELAEKAPEVTYTE
jgi:hypothetical protein